MDKEFLFGVGITNAKQEDILKYILYSLEKKDKKYYVVTPNPEIVVYATHHEAFKSILNNARLALCDGAGLIVAAKILGKQLKTRTTGVDLMESLCREIATKPITVGFLGGRHGVAERTAECLRFKYPGLRVSFTAEELPNLPTNKQEVSSIKYLVSSRDGKIQNTKYKIPNTDILFVAFGFPKQEEFMAEHLEKIPVKVMMGVGGAFDYISGQVPRAPESMRKIGLEWFFRLLVQPWRLKRQLALLEFIYLVGKEKTRRVI